MNTDGFILQRAGQREMLELLAQVPGVVEDLGVTAALADQIDTASEDTKEAM